MSDISAGLESIDERHGDSRANWAGTTPIGAVGGAQGLFETCAFHALGMAMDSKMPTEAPGNSKMLADGFPFALQAMGLRNKDGDLYSDAGGDIVTLINGLNAKDIVYASHPDLAVSMCGEETPSMTEMKVTLGIQQFNTPSRPHRAWINTANQRGWPQDGDDLVVAEAWHKVRS